MGLFSSLAPNDVASDQNIPQKSVDVWRDTPLRYAGYANEIGEAFRFRMPRLLIPSYAVAILYVIGDTADKANKAMKSGMPLKDVAYVGGDAFAWQFLASVAIPGFTINRVVTYSRELLKTSSSSSVKHPFLRTWGPTLLGLGLIPIIIHPIDLFVDKVFEKGVRPILGTSQLIHASSEKTAHSVFSSSPAFSQSQEMPKEEVSPTTKVTDDGSSTGNINTSTIFTKAQLEAMALYVSVDCKETNANFNACKAKHMDPERCLQAGKEVMLCVAQTYRKLNKTPESEKRFRNYMNCLDENGGEFSKCRHAKDDLDKAIGGVFEK